VSPFQTIRYDLEDGIVTILLDRPDKLNAINPRMMHELIEAIDRTDADDAVRAVILTGSGRAFCAGADISAGASAFDYRERSDDMRSDAVVNGIYRDGGGRVALRIFRSLKPVIAAINGPAVGAGATIPLSADIRIAASSARFGYVFARRGIVPESAASWFLPRIVGISTALEWCLSGRMVDAHEALAYGLVRSVHEPEALLPAARTLAREFVENCAPVSVALTRQMLWRMLGADHPMEAHKIDSRGIYARGASADVKEGVVSFLEKRPPKFNNTVSKDMPSYFPWWKERKYE